MTDIAQAQALADDKMRAEIARLLCKPQQVTVMTFLIPFAAAAALMAAVAALVLVVFP